MKKTKTKQLYSVKDVDIHIDIDSLDSDHGRSKQKIEVEQLNDYKSNYSRSFTNKSIRETESPDAVL